MLKHRKWQQFGCMVILGLTLVGCESESKNTSSDNKDTKPFETLIDGSPDIEDEPKDDDLTVDTDGPIDSDEPIGTDGPIEFDEPIDTDGPFDSDEPLDTDGPIDADEPIDTDGTSTVNNFKFYFDADYAESRDEDTLNSDAAAFGVAIEPLNKIPNLFNNAEIPVVYGECGTVNAFYSPAERVIVLCDELLVDVYSYFYDLIEESSSEVDDVNATAWTVAYSTMNFVLYHEVGHALNDIRDLESGGNFESVADAIATVLAVKTGQSFAAMNFAAYAQQNEEGSFANVHGSGLDRAGDILCWTLGSSALLAEQFSDLSTQLVTAGRDCVAEYADQLAFVSRLVPNLSGLPPLSSLRSAPKNEFYDVEAMDNLLTEG